MYRVVRLALLPACGLWLAACAASDFAGPVTAFSDATKTAATSFKTSRESLAKLSNERRLRAAADGGNIIAMDGDCRVGSPRCRLLVVDKSGTKKPLTNSFEGLQELMDGLVAYTDNLVAIVKADTTGELAKGTEAAKSNLTSLAQSGTSLAQALNLKGVSFARVSPFISPVAEAVNFGLNKALEAKKIAALREATAEMEEMFPALTTVFNAVNDAALRIERNQLFATYRKADSAFRRNPNDATRDAYKIAAQAYDAALTSNPKNVFDALREAHGVLAQSLQSHTPSFNELFALLQKATEEANKLAEINKAFQKAGAASTKS
jgi:hypothetical protein